jgi:hypothetical protein
MEGTTIMSADNYPANRPDNDDENTPGAEVVDLDTWTWTRTGRPGAAPAADARPLEADPAADERPADTPAADDDGPVIEGTVVPVDTADAAPRDYTAPRRHPYGALGHCWQHVTAIEPLRGGAALAAGIRRGGAA